MPSATATVLLGTGTQIEVPLRARPICAFAETNHYTRVLVVVHARAIVAIRPIQRDPSVGPINSNCNVQSFCAMDGRTGNRMTHLIRRRFAVFIDMDGALLGAAVTPLAPRIPDYLPELLHRLSLRLDGALALVSGRTLETLDALFAPYRLAAAAEYGCELRISADESLVPNFDMKVLNLLHEECLWLARNTAGISVLRTRSGITIHHNGTIDPGTPIRTFLQDLTRELGNSFSLQQTECAYEIVPAGYSKANAIVEFMRSEPFFGRLPIFVGDAATDEIGFETVNCLGGSTIRVGVDGGCTRARQSLATHLAVHRVLAGLVDDYDWLILQLQAAA